MIQLITIRIRRAFAKTIPFDFFIKLYAKHVPSKDLVLMIAPFSIIRHSTGSEYDFQTFEYRIYCAINIFVYSMVVLHKY